MATGAVIQKSWNQAEGCLTGMTGSGHARLGKLRVLAFLAPAVGLHVLLRCGSGVHPLPLKKMKAC